MGVWGCLEFGLDEYDAVGSDAQGGERGGPVETVEHPLGEVGGELVQHVRVAQTATPTEEELQNNNETLTHELNKPLFLMLNDTWIQLLCHKAFALYIMSAINPKKVFSSRTVTQ